MRQVICKIVFWLSFVLAALSSPVLFIVVNERDPAATWIEGTFGQNEETIGIWFVYLALALVVFCLVAWIASLDPRLDGRPRISTGAGFFGAGWLLVFSAFAQWLAQSDAIAFASAFGGGLVAAGLVIGFELIAGAMCQSAVRGFDRKGKGGAALFATRTALLFRPGQDELLASVTLELFKRGQRGEVCDRLRASYAGGARNPELLEALCQLAAEEKKPDEYLRYIKDLFDKFPDDEQLQEAYLEELLEQGRQKEALEHIEKHGVPEDVPSLERYANLLLNLRKYEDASEVAEKIAEVEGIPFRKAEAVLKRVLELDKECFAAANQLAAQAERMARKDLAIRWLDASIQMNRKQPAVAMKLADMLDDADMGSRLEALLHDMVADSPGDGPLALRYAQVLHGNGRAKEAIVQFERLRQQGREREKTEATVALAKIHFEMENVGAAKTAAAEALSLRLDAAQEGAMRALLRRIERAEFTAELAEMLDRAGNEPHNVPLQIECLRRLCSAGHIDRAVAHADALLRNVPASRIQVIEALQAAIAKEAEGSFPLLNILADLQVAESRYDEALDTVRLMAKRSLNPASAIREGAQKILRRSPHHLNTLRSMGELYQELGQFTEMIHAWSLYLANGGEETEQIDRSLAKAYISLNEYENARRFVQALLKMSTGAEAERDNAALLKRLVPMALEAGQPADAIQLQDHLEKIADPTDKEMRQLRVRVREAQRAQRLEALKARVESEGGSDARTLEELGDLYMEREEFNEAITAFQRAARAKGASRIPVAKLAYSFAKKRMFDLAGETLAEIRLSLDDSSEELEHLMIWIYRTGEALEDAHMFDRASRLYKQLMKIDAGYKDVIQKVEKLAKK